MNISKHLPALSSIGAALALSMTLSTPVAAAPAFTVDASVLGGTKGTFQADQMGGYMSSLIIYDPSTSTTTGSGYIDISGFGYKNQALKASVTDYGNTYELFITYSFKSNVAGTFGAVGQQDPFTELVYTLWGAAAGTTVFTSASAADNIAATAVNATAKAIGNGTLIAGTSAFNANGGATVNSTTAYANTEFGNTFFTEPSPFYNLAFNSFNNTLQGLLRVDNRVEVNQAQGNIDFNMNQVPEPASLALVGLGLLGAGVIRRKTAKK